LRNHGHGPTAGSDGSGPVAFLTLGEVVALVGGRLSGDPRFSVRGIASLADAGPEELALLAAPRYRDQVGASVAGALLVAADLDVGLVDPRPRVVVDDPHAALIPLLGRLHPPPTVRPGVHPTAVLGRGVVLGSEVEIGPYAVLGEGVVLGDRVCIGAHGSIGTGCRIGEDSLLHPHVTLYEGVRIGAHVILHGGVRVGSDGFGYAFTGDGHRKVPQVGGCVVEDDVEIGANSCIDRGSIGDTVIGRGSKLDNLVHVAHNVRIGPHCILTGQTGIAGSTVLGAGVIMGGQSGVGGHVVVGDDVRIGAKSAVFQDVAAGKTVVGTPASDAGAMRRAWTLVPRLPELFRRLRMLERSGKAPEGVPDPSGQPGDGG